MSGTWSIYFSLILTRVFALDITEPSIIDGIQLFRDVKKRLSRLRCAEGQIFSPMGCGPWGEKGGPVTGIICCGVCKGGGLDL
ncbi:hypothetical protein N431DRAFT_80612 [Stipitochalara longipes BDJ]|nr:hypothetical protein N431DRAFT_80612 [Stipitochalara longipes BDJ]